MRECLTAVLLLLSTPAVAASYEVELDPAPFDATDRADVIGSVGDVTATLDGSRLMVSGNFSHLTSRAISASLRIGLAKGVPGAAIGYLMVSPATEGTVSGLMNLTPAQVSALDRQALYVRIDSEKAPEGNLQGWLEGK
jgi:hypothetical protein